MYIFERFRWVYLLFVFFTFYLLYQYYIADYRLALIFLLSFLPTIIYLAVARYSDVGAKEPRGAITWGVLVGMLLIYPAIYLELFLLPYALTLVGVYSPSTMTEAIIYFSAFNILVVAPVEELLKFSGFVFSTRFHKETDLPSDYIIYMIAVSGGFAIYENLVYLISYAMGNSLPLTAIYRWFLDEQTIISLFDFTIGIQVIVLRNLAAVPLHLGLGVLMGTRYAKFKRGRDVGVTGFGRALSLFLMIFLPIVIHGLYNTMSQIIVIVYGELPAIAFSISFSLVLNVVVWKKAVRLREVVKETLVDPHSESTTIEER